MLLSYVEVYIKKADYNQALDVGNRDNKIIRKESFFYSDNTKTKQIRKKKDLKQLFADVDIKQYLKKNAVKINAEDLIELFENFN